LAEADEGFASAKTGRGPEAIKKSTSAKGARTKVKVKGRSSFSSTGGGHALKGRGNGGQFVAQTSKGETVRVTIIRGKPEKRKRKEKKENARGGTIQADAPL